MSEMDGGDGDTGVGDSSMIDAYASDTDTSNDLYNASSQASAAGDSYGAYLLNEASGEASAQANQDYQAYYGTGEFADADADTVQASGYDSAGSAWPTDAGEADPGTADSGAGAYDAGTAGGEDSAQSFADYAGS